MSDQKDRTDYQSNKDLNPDWAQKIWIESLVGYALRRGSNLFTADFLKNLKDTGLRPVHMSILSVVEENPGIRQGQIGKALHIARENTAPLVNGLTKRDLLIRKRNQQDKRAFSIFLSEAGQSALTRGKQVIENHEQVLMQRLSDTEKAELLRLLYKL